MSDQRAWLRRRAAARRQVIAAAILFDVTAVALLIAVTSVVISLWPTVFNGGALLVPVLLLSIPIAHSGQRFGYWFNEKQCEVSDALWRAKKGYARRTGR